MSYVDTCVVLMFANRDDALRKAMGLGRGHISSILKNARFCVPMAALGESFHMIRIKSPDDCMTILGELNGLLDDGFLETRFIGDPAATFTLAKTISATTVDDRDQISPMDAFIAASAATDQTCAALYTTDSRLISNTDVSEEISSWRDSQGFPPMVIRDVSELFAGRSSRRR